MQENKMGTMPIDKLIISMSLPIMISMLVQALWTVFSWLRSVKTHSLPYPWLSRSKI